MKQRWSYILVLAGLTCSPAYGDIIGKVVGRVDQKPIEKCIITLYDAQGKSVAYTTSATDGTFRLQADPSSQSKLIVRMMGYKAQTLSGEEIVNDGKLVISLDEEAFRLKEVAVKAQRIRERGDTISYAVAPFAQERDRTIGDVLARMPGISVEQSGKVTYQGVDINKLYIEGQDLLGGRYGVATKGISASDIARVEVFEHHQPMRVLQGMSPSDQAAINLKLKDGKHSAWLGHGEVAGGVSSVAPKGLWGANLFAMKAGRKSQTLVSIKTNNIGIDLEGEQQDFSQPEKSTDLIPQLSLSLGSAPHLDDERKRLNRDLMSSLSQLWKVSPIVNLKLQADYLDSKENSRAERQSIYFRTDSDQIILEEEDGSDQRKMLRGSVGLEINEKSYFLNNTTSLQADWSKMNISVQGTYPNRQEGKIPQVRIANKLLWIQRLGDRHLITLGNDSQYEQASSQLRVYRADDTYGSQRLSQYALSSRSKAAYSFQIGVLLIGLEGVIDARLRRASAESAFGGFPLSSDFLGDIRHFALELSPIIGWESRRLSAQLSLPISSRIYNLYRGERREHILNYMPKLSLRYRVSSYLSLSLQAGHSKKDLDLSEIYDGALLTDYRNLRSGYDGVGSVHRYSMSGRVQYRHARSGVFGHFMAMHSWVEHPYYRHQDFVGDYILESYAPMESQSRSLSLLGSLNKTLDFMRGGVGINLMYNEGKRSIRSEDVDRSYTSDYMSLVLRLNGYIVRNLFFLYEGGWINTKLSSSINPSKRLHNLTNSLELSYTPWSQITFGSKVKHYNNELSQDVRKSVLMLDANVSYRLSDKVELDLSIHNLLNHRTYAYSSYGALNRISVSRDIRGRELLLSLRVK